MTAGAVHSSKDCRQNVLIALAQLRGRGNGTPNMEQVATRAGYQAAACYRALQDLKDRDEVALGIGAIAIRITEKGITTAGALVSERKEHYARVKRNGAASGKG